MSMYSSSCSSSQNKSNNNISNADDESNTNKLKAQWSLGRDVWKNVPILSASSSSTVHIQTKVRLEPRPDNDTISSSISSSSSFSWPEIVQSSILYGFGAYNPRGEVMPDEINREQHLLMQSDIVNGLQQLNTSTSQDTVLPPAFWWQGASIWEDGSSERGFIVAFPKQNKNMIPSSKSGSQEVLEEDHDHDEKIRMKMKEAHDFIIQLAAKYNQGAVYRFEMEVHGQQRLMRETIPVLDAGTDACVEVEIDEYDDNGDASASGLIDLSLFE